MSLNFNKLAFLLRKSYYILKQNEGTGFVLLQQVDNLGILTNVSPYLQVH